MSLFSFAAHAAEAAGEEHSSGLPQLEVATYPSQIFWLIVSLLVLFFVLSRIALPRIAGAIEERHDAIEDDLDRAEDFKRKAAKAEQAYDAALAAARAKAQEIAAETRASIQADLDDAIHKADAEIAAKAAESEKRIDEIRASAMASVEQVAGEAAEAIVAAIIPGAEAGDEARAAAADRAKG